MVRPTGAAYRADIDGLRAVAIAAVVFYHAYPNGMPGGFVGVDIFFVISGFLITGIVAGQLDRGAFSLVGFYAARVRRLFPALATMLLAVLALGWFVLMADEYSALGQQAVAASVFVANLQFWRTANYFDEPITKHLLHLWSLGVEEQFYLIWPLLLMAVRERRGRIALAGGVFVLSLAYGLFLATADPTAAFYSPLPRAWELMTGALLALCPLALPSRHRQLAATGGAVLIGVGLFGIDASQPFPGWRALAPCGGAVLLIAAGREGWPNRLLALRPAVAVGLISYPLYLWHWPVLTLAAALDDGRLPHGAAKVALLFLALALAIATWRLVERGRWRHPRVGAPALILLMAGIAVAAGLIAQSGVPGRALNRDPRRQFVAAYRLYVKSGLAAPYRRACDFVGGASGTRPALPPACTAPGTRATILLWGDSHAQALSPGLTGTLPPGVALAQIATSSCPPTLLDLSRTLSCRRSTAAAFDAVRRLRPAIVVLAQHEGHEATDWTALADRLRSLGAGHVVLVGPAPSWTPSLPALVAGLPHPLAAVHLGAGLDPAAFVTDRLLADRYGAARQLTYLSLTSTLCRRDACLVWVPGTRILTALDYGHLSPAASRWLARARLAPALLPFISPQRTLP